MCGRFVSSTPPDQLAAYFGAAPEAEALLEPNWNVAPTTQVYAVVQRDDQRVLDTFRWGLVPFWAKDLKIGSRMINARSETLATKNAFKKPFARTRCIIPADSFYEWVQLDGHDKKTPMRIHRVDEAPFAFAGLWTTWRDPEGEPDAPPVASCTIITGSPNERISRIHDRMPVLLPHTAWADWLDPDQRDTEHLQQYFTPAPAELFTFHPVDTTVNNSRSRGEELITPVHVEGAPVPTEEAA